MAKGPRIENQALLAAGLELMQQNGNPLSKVDIPGRAMIYSLRDGKTVRVRTCNDHVLVVLADRPANDAKLNIEGTDFLLVVMPETERTHGNVIAYLVPTDVAVEAVRKTHRDWLSSGPNTKGDNRTWNLWFDDDDPPKANGFARKWQAYRLAGIANTQTVQQGTANNFATGSDPTDIKYVVETARQRIAAAAGVSPTAVRITVDFGL